MSGDIHSEQHLRRRSLAPQAADQKAFWGIEQIASAFYSRTQSRDLNALLLRVLDHHTHQTGRGQWFLQTNQKTSA